MADVANVRTSHNGSEPSTAELVQRATEQMSRLVRDELALARAELTEKGKHAGIGVGLLAGGGALAFLGLGALITAAILLLALVLPAWAAALIVAVAVFLIAGVLALLGRKQVKQAVPPVPQATVQSLRADVDVVSAAVKDRGRA
ncbi:phage holin family protein [Micromonospora craniellae]|uniref:Phage holin family protein n=1 Tax=Micromonospora craniellae TaxID=2294034 RepID=A0A372G275_9ACTN|nr:phage holin family protein [Micromonospora craniellae]QOC92671.1 phage holin family protein [Micromonospora craniellae]RFS46820.1 phage holin family protein [Micromonospora craniellae]